MSALTASSSGGHQHHSMHQSDLEVLDALTALPSTSSIANGLPDPTSITDARGGGRRRRPLDTLQALRRPPIDPIVLAASLSSGPHVTRHHFLHSFGPKVESKQMTRSERKEKLLQEQDGKASHEHSNNGGEPSRPSIHTTPTTKTRARAGSYANCDAEERNTLREVQDIIGEIEATSILPKSEYPSRQAPRSERLRIEREAKEQMERKKAERRRAEEPARQQDLRPDITRKPSVQIDQELVERRNLLQQQQTALSSAEANTLSSTQQSFSSIVRPPPLFVRCYARTRIPTPHGEIFCHLYRNNRDQKEHLALVIDPAQNAPEGDEYEQPGRLIRSRTLDEVWGPTETEMERIVRGAYVGRLGPTLQEASRPQHARSVESQQQETPLVRIHSECYTGETIGSQRCDCGEQLDEAIRLIHADGRPAKGVVVYLRQEGRGIGLLDKLMAYNLQDMGHDTVAANILLGHLADARKYDIAAEILRDLGVASCRLLTNNPEKMEALEAEGIHVTRRVAMVPRIWRMHSHVSRRRKSRRAKQHSSIRKMKAKPLHASIISQFDSDGANNSPNLVSTSDDEQDDGGDFSDDSHDSYVEHLQRRSGATLIGGSITRGPELEKYLRTKVERMGHLLELPPSPSSADNKDVAHAADDDEERILV